MLSVNRLIIAAAFTAAAALIGCTYASPDLMDANDHCLMSHTWETTTVSTGRPIWECPGWFLERRRLDAKAGVK